MPRNENDIIYDVHRAYLPTCTVEELYSGATLIKLTALCGASFPKASEISPDLAEIFRRLMETGHAPQRNLNVSHKTTQDKGGLSRSAMKPSAPKNSKKRSFQLLGYTVVFTTKLRESGAKFERRRALQQKEAYE